jgi:four helix bundle protein
MSEKKSVLKDKSFVFAIRIVKLYKYLAETKSEYILSKQLLRSGTAVGALIREAQNAESMLDFAHKLSIAQKECDESIYWLDLLKETGYISLKEHKSIVADAIEILRITRSSILTTRQRTKKTHNS